MDTASKDNAREAASDRAVVLVLVIVPADHDPRTTVRVVAPRLRGANAQLRPTLCPFRG
jgi:hypothetical protein